MNTTQVEIDTKFLNEIGIQQIVHMFDLLPDTLFWIKNEKSQIIYANQALLDTYGFKSLNKIIGKADDSFSPPHIAKQFMMDDKKVMEGELVTNRIELNLRPNGEFAWFSTTKRPLLNSKGEIVGSYGFTHHLERSSHELSTISAIKAPVEYIRKNFHQDINIEELAKLAFLSVSALERRFKKYLSKTPKQFLNEIRLENARRLLIETQQPIMEIAYQCGFSEHSYFSKQFKALFGILPSQLRKQILDSNSSSEQSRNNV
uniref:AraC family transcriptional regulator n=1 Tax=Ningiella ruwaisensis TaxID=2364274 RepID=UPI0010A009D1|nr:AraC family transcriptional regulator [Ningiella ruwaisensis]